ncbi:hypothetical protein BH20ACT19_BH20ACT19_08010 [soil metagenome]
MTVTLVAVTGRGLLYVALSVVMGIGAAALGYGLAHALRG